MQVALPSSTSRYTALILKLTGVILILGVLLDYVVLSFPPNFNNFDWLVGLINEWVGRGTVPLLGVAFIVFGTWIDRTSGHSPADRSALMTGALVLSLLLGIIFLLFVPLHFNSSRLSSAASTRQINDQAAQAQQQLEATLAQQKAKVTALLANPQQVAQLQQQLDSAEIPADQQAQLQQLKDTLQKVKADPKVLDQEVDKARSQGMSQIQQQQQQQLDQVQGQMRNSRNQATLNSFLLSIGYFIVAATGLGTARAGRVKSSRRSRK
ncbi:MAG: HpsJ family protein [Drouetiella hepatica Uher 2000/2452]|uniref:HpsJ family protein n=1 Tax=Drouetiella hepatica Uher 2000/2452 TaxID=904376 RepID=A0A951Q9H3_9CYAN|nr:HpsJ family protein [Drouetiella hepatica Uher 2000/2452]